MKSISIFLVSCMAALSVWAQNNLSTITIQVQGNKNRQIRVDGTNYNVNNNLDVNGVNMSTPISITHLQAGQHTLQVIRNNRYNNGSYSTAFTVRLGYDLDIIVNSNGSVQITESRSRRRGGGFGNQNRAAMSEASFNRLQQEVRSQWWNSAKVRVISNAFTNTGNYFSTSQARQLIGLVNSQPSRLDLAKSVYPLITDPDNFSQLYYLLTSQARRNELEEYVAAYDTKNRGKDWNRGDNNWNNGNNNGNDGNNNNNGNHNWNRASMSVDRFNILLQDARQQWPSNSRMTFITDAFANQNNYFSTAQAKQLIELVSDEDSRLQLAKASYRTITDPENFSQVYNLFSNQSRRNDLAAYVNSYSGNTNPYIYKTPMTQSSFNTLYSDVKNTFGFGAKMSSLTNIFSNSSNYFTTAQAKSLIELVSDESNRLQLAKLSYRNIVDPDNFSQLYVVFNSQLSRDELAAYVNSYAGVR